MNNMIGMACLLLVAVVQVSGRQGSGFVRSHGTMFNVDGRPLYVNGFNSYWLMSVASDPSQRYKVTSVFEEAKNHGLNVARTWAFNDGQYNSLQLSPGVYDEQVFQALDFVVTEARKHGIRLILSMVNNYDNFGGKGQYVQWARNAGQSVNSDEEFFTNPTVKGYFKNHIRTLLSRVNSMNGISYKEDPTIFAWELMNEPRYPGDYSGKAIQEWIEEMASHVKSIDKNHMLEAGVEGFYGESRQNSNPGFNVGTDFIANNQVQDIDFATVHAYPDIWLKGSDEGTQMAFLERWIQAHLDDATQVLRKPVIFAEFGKSSKDQGFYTAQRDNLISMVYGHVYASAKRGGAGAGSMFWQLMAEGMSNMGDGYEIVLSDQPSTSYVISAQSHRLNELTHLLTRLFETENQRKAFRGERRTIWRHTRGNNNRG